MDKSKKELKLFGIEHFSKVARRTERNGGKFVLQQWVSKGLTEAEKNWILIEKYFNRSADVNLKTLNWNQ